MISKYLLPIVATLAVTGWITAGLSGWAYMGKRDEVVEVREAANTATAMAVAEAERLTREVSDAHNARLLKSMASKYERERKARELAEDLSEEAEDRSEKQLETIEKLMVEASIDDIPDSTEALNVFIPESVVSGLRLRSDNCAEAVPGPGAGDSAACIGSAGAAADDFPTGDFSNITYGDGMKLWAMDRATIQTLNGQLLAIGLLDQPE